MANEDGKSTHQQAVENASAAAGKLIQSPGVSRVETTYRKRSTSLTIVVNRSARQSG